jgi:hypothetical protein
VSVDELAQLVCHDRLALELLAALRDGRLIVPKPASEAAPPLPLTASVGAI